MGGKFDYSQLEMVNWSHCLTMVDRFSMAHWVIENLVHCRTDDDILSRGHN